MQWGNDRIVRLVVSASPRVAAVLPGARTRFGGNAVVTESSLVAVAAAILVFVAALVIVLV